MLIVDAGLRLRQQSSQAVGLLQAKARAGPWSPAQSASLAKPATVEVNYRCETQYIHNIHGINEQLYQHVCRPWSYIPDCLLPKH